MYELRAAHVPRAQASPSQPVSGPRVSTIVSSNIWRNNINLNFNRWQRHFYWTFMLNRNAVVRSHAAPAVLDSHITWEYFTFHNVFQLELRWNLSSCTPVRPVWRMVYLHMKQTQYCVEVRFRRQRQGGGELSAGEWSGSLWIYDSQQSSGANSNIS